MRLSLRESFPLHFGDRWEEAREIYLERFRAIHLDRLSAAARPRGDAARARRRTASISAWSATRPARCCAARSSGSAGPGYFGSVVGAGDAPADKPGRDPVHLALDGSGVAAGREVWLVGDTARRYGMRPRTAAVLPVLLGDGGRSAEEFSRFAPDAVLRRWDWPVSLCAGLAIRRRAPIFVSDSADSRALRRCAARAGRLGSKNEVGRLPMTPKNHKMFKTCS